MVWVEGIGSAYLVRAELASDFGGHGFGSDLGRA